MPAEQDVLLRLLGGIFAVVVVLLLFHSLTVSIEPEFIRLSYGVGIISRRIGFASIEAVQPAANQWWWGFGIRKIPNGWMWNISGLRSVELKLKNGRLFRIGTDEPGVLAAIVKEKLKIGSSYGEG